MASFRADLVDGLLADAGVSALVGTRVFPIIFTFEDMLNSKANKNKFPRITVEQLSREQEDNINTHDQLVDAIYQVSLFHEVHIKAGRSRVNSVVVKERNKIRTGLDNLFDAVETYLRDTIFQAVVGSHYVRRSHIANSIEEEFRVERNRTILTNRIVYECSYNKT